MMRVLTDLGLPVGITREGPSLRIEVALHGDERYAAAAEAGTAAAAAASLRPCSARPRWPWSVPAGGEHSVGRAVLRSLRAARFGGAVLAVNPHATEIDGRALLAVGRRPAAARRPGGAHRARDGGRTRRGGVRGARGACRRASSPPGSAECRVCPAGVRELADRYGHAPRRAEHRRGGGTGAEHGRLDTTFTAETAPPGDIGLVAQSGGIAIAAVTAWRRLGLGLSAMVADRRRARRRRTRRAGLVRRGPGDRAGRPLRRVGAGPAGPGPHRCPPVRPRAGAGAGRPARPRPGSGPRPRTRPGRPPPWRCGEAAYASGGIQSVAALPDLAAAVGLLRGQPLPRRPVRGRAHQRRRGRGAGGGRLRRRRPGGRSAPRRAAGAAARRAAAAGQHGEPCRHQRCGTARSLRRGAHAVCSRALRWTP